MKMDIKNGFKSGDVYQYFENGNIETISFFKNGFIEVNF